MPTSLAYTTFSEILTLTPLSLEFGWFSASAPRVRMWFMRTPEYLMYAGEVEGVPEFDTGYETGQFVEGLWTQNCLELFIAEQGSSRYQEFNLAPGGAWWTCSFSDVRQREAQQRKPSGVVTLQQREAGFWRAALRVPLSELAVRLTPDETRFNLTAIVGSQSAQSFRSFADIKTSKPDFHQPKFFVTSACEVAPRST